MKFTRLYIILITILCGLTSCTESAFIGAVNFDGELWREGENAVFEFDTKTFGSTPQSIDIFIRYKSAGQGTKFPIYVKTDAPNRKFWVDTLEVELNAAQSGAIRTLSVPYRGGVVWANGGAHSISLFADRSLPYIVSAGVEIK